jgi:hypothetical protein
MIYVDFKQSWLDHPDKDDYLRDKLDTLIVDSLPCIAVLGVIVGALWFFAHSPI